MIAIEPPILAETREAGANKPMSGSTSLDGSALATLRTAHLQMIQGIVGRMSSNSAILKGFCVTVTGAAVALSAGDLGSRSWWLLVAIGLFALCDAGYLRMERDFRDLYRTVAERSLDQAENLAIDRPTSNASGYVSALISWSVGIFYGVIAAGVLLTGALVSR